MIAYLKGILAEREPTRAVIEVGGVGYELLIPVSTYEKLPRTGNETKVLVCHCVREDDEILFGFATKDEKELFGKLTSVSGVGPKAAMAIVSLLSPEKFAVVVSSGDTKTLAKAQGIGAKTAARIVLELKDKVSAVATADGEEDVGVTDLGGIRDDALEALMVLGYQRQAAQKALAGCKGDTLEELMRAALKKIGSKM